MVSKICRSGRKAIEVVLWCIGIICFPVVGLIVWLLLGPSDTVSPPYRAIV